MLIVVFFAGYASCVETQRAVITDQKQSAQDSTVSYTIALCAEMQRAETVPNHAELRNLFKLSNS